MARLTAARRAKMPAKSFAGPGKSFPISDPTHARLAISGATRSENAGNISAGTADKIKAAARAKLGDKPQHAGAVPGSNTNPNTVDRAARRRLPSSAVGNSGNGRAGRPSDAVYDFDRSTPAQSASMHTRAPQGAADGLGHGRGGMALHPTMKGANAEGYEREHSSKHR